MEVGDSFWFQSYGTYKNHFHVVIAVEGDKAIVVYFSTRRPKHRDLCCIVTAGEHPELPKT